jgi:hypothetical protein
MSFDIGAVQPSQGARPTSNTHSPTNRVQKEPVLSTSEDAVSVDTFPSTPPPEVSAAIAAAGQAYDELAASGQFLHFGTDPQTGQLSIELHDESGNFLSSVSPGQALEIAAGQVPS